MPVDFNCTKQNDASAGSCRLIFSAGGCSIEKPKADLLIPIFARSRSCGELPLRQTGLVRATFLGIFGALMSVGFADFAHCKDVGNDGPAEAALTWPNIYFDLRTNYGTVPANTLSIGFGSSSLSSTVALQTLAAQPNSATFSARLPLSSRSHQSIAVDVPLTVDVSDRLSLYGGFSASTSQSGISDWSTLAVSSWNAGFQADVFQQDGGSIPTITLQSTITRSVPDSPNATTSLNTTVEFRYALNDDETKGLLAGAQYTRTAIDSPLATINPNVIGFVGGYYQWENNWKFTGRIGIQSFGGARLLNLTPFQPFTQPIVRLDVDRLDGNDNRLVGITAQFAWVPKPSFQFTIRTPLYAVRN